MNLWKLSVRNLFYKPINLVLSVLLLALSVAMLSVAIHLKHSFEHQLYDNIPDIDMVMGAKGSPLQLVLSSVMHIDNPTGNINYAQAKKVTRSALIKTAVPISYGDNYKGYRIVGTVPEFLKLYKATLQKGSLEIKTSGLVIGAGVAAKLHLKLGDHIHSSHGLVEEATEVHEHELQVTGILQPTGTVIDQLLITSLNTVWDVHEHEALPVADEDREITAMLVSFKNPMGLLQFPRRINTTTTMQAALPKFELERLFSLMGVGFKTIGLIGLAVLLVSGLSVFISLYRVVLERKYEIAVMRTYGATRLQLFSTVYIESFLTAVMGIFSGFLLSKVGLLILRNYMEETYRYSLNVFSFETQEMYLSLGIFGVVTLATLLAVIPVFRMNVSNILADEN